MKILANPDFARAMCIIYSLDDNALNGFLSGTQRDMFWNFVHQFVSKIEFRTGKTVYDAQTGVVDVFLDGYKENDDCHIIYNVISGNIEVNFNEEEKRSKIFGFIPRPYVEFVSSINGIDFKLHFGSSK